MQRQGFVLPEVIVAVVILSSLMVVTAQVWQSLAQNKQRQNWVDDAELIRQGALDFWIVEGRAPLLLADFFSTEQQQGLSLPWQQTWQLANADEWLELSVQAPSINAANWFASQLAGAFTQYEKVIIPIWQPASEAMGETLLHRVEQFGRPHLNRMHTNLDMAGHDVVNVGTLSATRIETDSVSAKQLNSDVLRSDKLHVQDLKVVDVITPNTSLSTLTYWVDQYQQLWTECQNQGKCI